MTVVSKRFKQLSYSTLSTAMMCAKRLWFKAHHGAGRASGAMRMGNWAHSAVEAHHQQMLDENSRLPVNSFLGIFEQNFDTGIKSEDIEWKGEDPVRCKSAFLEDLLPRVYDEYLSQLVPVKIEHRFDIEIDRNESGEGESIQVLGFVDFVGNIRGKRGLWVRDTKFRAKPWDKMSTVMDDQLTLYQMAMEAEGLKIVGTAVDEMVHTGGNKSPKKSQVNMKDTEYDPRMKKGESDFQRVIQGFRELQKQIDLCKDDPEAYPGAPRSAWWCSEKFCNWHACCPNGGGGDYSP